MPRPPAQGRPRRTSDAFTRGTFATLGTDTVTVIRNEGTEDEESFEVDGHIQAKAGYFDVDTPIFEGDVVLVRDLGAQKGSNGGSRQTKG